MDEPTSISRVQRKLRLADVRRQAWALGARLPRSLIVRLEAAFRNEIAPTFDYLFRASYTFRVPLIAAILSYIILSQLQQVQELYFTTMSDGLGGWLRMFITAALLFALSILLIVLVRVGECFLPPPLSKAAFLNTHTAMKLACGTLPFIGVLQGILFSFVWKINSSFYSFFKLFQEYQQKHPADPNLKAFPPEIFDFELLNPGYPLIAFAVFACAGVVFFISPISRRLADSIYRECIGAGTSFHRTKLYRVLLILTAFCILFFLIPNIPTLPDAFVEVPRTFGALSLTLSFLLCLSAHVAALTEIGEQSGYPIISGVLVAAVLFSYFDWNDNHAIRDRLVDTRPCPRDKFLGTRCPTPPPIPDITHAFTDWFGRRPEDVRARFSESAYPVYIVTAEGGGIYAAAQAALFLAKVYDRCPALSHHIFAISGVSGGSLGAAVIAALINAKAQELGEKSDEFFKSCPGKAPPAGSRSFEARAMEYLQQDFLSPAIAAGLFPDFLQRFIPWPIATLDRGRAFERALEQSWRKIHNNERDDFAKDFRTTWSPEGFAPMLLLNTTIVEQGKQAVIAPVDSFFGEPRMFFGQDHSLVTTRFDIPLSTAVGLSARFTALAPAGYHVDRSEDIYKPPRRFVDGGYVENSGVETVNAVINLLADKRLRSIPTPVELRLLIISGTSGGGLGRIERIRMNELGSPIVALLNSRVERAERAISSVELASFPRPVRVGIPFAFFKPPLGWHISQFTLSRVGAYLGTAERCDRIFDWRGPFDDPDFLGLMVDLRNALRGNHCSACSMIRAAQGRESKSDLYPNPVHPPPPLCGADGK
jgi:hypothetical protein